MMEGCSLEDFSVTARLPWLAIMIWRVEGGGMEWCTVVKRER